MRAICGVELRQATHNAVSTSAIGYHAGPKSTTKIAPIAPAVLSTNPNAAPTQT
jgi:hypothetical protein